LRKLAIEMAEVSVWDASEATVRIYGEVKCKRSGEGMDTGAVKGSGEKAVQVNGKVEDGEEGKIAMRVEGTGADAKK
jgi:hypothetical protein